MFNVAVGCCYAVFIAVIVFCATRAEATANTPETNAAPPIYVFRVLLTFF